MMGRSHTRGPSSCENPTPRRSSDWPYADASIQEFGIEIVSINALPGVVKDPADVFDYMSYCGSVHRDGNVWTSPWTYTKIFSDTLRVQATAQDVKATATEQPYFIASGLVYTDDTATLNPIWVITTTVAPQNPPAGTQYCLEAQN
ncbi:MAG: hypothetical protein ACPLRM_09080, partial [Anaerolineae bacterium]